MLQQEWKRCSDLKRTNLIIATKQFEPFMFIRKIGNGTEATAGIDYQFLKLLSVGMNFQYNYIMPEDNKWGVLEEDNTWSGIIGLVKQQVADAGLSGLGIDLPRSQAVRFTVPYHFEQISFITKRSEEKSKTFAMVYPFTLTVWICLLVTLLIWTAVIYTTERFNRGIRGDRSIRVMSVFWYFLGSLIGKSGNTTRFKAPGIERLLAIWWIAVIAILSFYSSLLTSFITYPGFEAQIETFSDLADAIDRNEIEVGSIVGSAPYNVIKLVEYFVGSEFLDAFQIFSFKVDKGKNGKSTVLKSLNDSVRRNVAENLVHSIPEGVQMVSKRNYAFIFTKTALETEAYMNYRDEKLFVSDDSMYTALGGMALSPKFKCRHTINKYVKRFLSMGLFSKWKKDLVEITQRPFSLTKDITALTLKDLQGPFYLLLLGEAIATVSFLLENFTRTYFPTCI
ncbi:glutamate receptor ionotropic, delta-1 [Nephila pilipes]|uniref:Glutamate receptor ionotropic, delta-1 n=1 Tax=Nephila pilipes TaxID=299642 RepID=A0A8X6NK64_NEPPI|nr:glutamate receptor ionotropic, delta-1 [Nephila pilipes]